MLEVFKNVLTIGELKKLVEYFYSDNIELVIRNTQSSKHPIWSKDTWPQNIIEPVLNKIIPAEYEVEEVWFSHNTASVRGLHIDTSPAFNKKNWLAILFPLEFVGAASTVLFENFFNSSNCRFSHDGLTDITVTDFSQIENFNSNKRFNEEIYKKHLSYMDINDLHGMTLAMIYKWKIGEALVFERQRVHAQGYISDYKLSLIILVNRK